MQKCGPTAMASHTGGIGSHADSVDSAAGLSYSQCVPAQHRTPPAAQHLLPQALLKHGALLACLSLAAGCGLLDLSRRMCAAWAQLHGFMLVMWLTLFFANISSSAACCLFPAAVCCAGWFDWCWSHSGPHTHTR
jgi:hypothetical protein